jgi:hypothetical protein
MSRLSTPSHRVRRLPIGTLASEIWASAHLPIGVRSEPTPPPCPGFDVAPPAPGGLSADGPATFGQQPAVPPVVDRVSLDTESFADLDRSNRLMLRVLVRHGAPGPAPGRKGDALGSQPQGLLRTRPDRTHTVAGHAPDLTHGVAGRRHAATVAVPSGAGDARRSPARSLPRLLGMAQQQSEPSHIDRVGLVPCYSPAPEASDGPQGARGNETVKLFDVRRYL